MSWCHQETFSDVIRIAGRHKESVITASLVLYLTTYFFVGIAGVVFQAQPAAAQYGGVGETVGNGLDTMGSIAGGAVDTVTDAGSSAVDAGTGAVNTLKRQGLFQSAAGAGAGAAAGCAVGAVAAGVGCLPGAAVGAVAGIAVAPTGVSCSVDPSQEVCRTGPEDDSGEEPVEKERPFCVTNPNHPECVEETIEPDCEPYADDCDDTTVCWDSEGTLSTKTRSVPDSCSVCGEPVPNYGEQCSVGAGACNRLGTVQCDGSCSVSPGSPSGEVCDGVDNDCDGGVDENPDSLCSAGESCLGGSCTRTTCDPSSCEWVEVGCGVEQCADHEMAKTQECDDPNCPNGGQVYCISDPSCVEDRKGGDGDDGGGRPPTEPIRDETEPSTEADLPPDWQNRPVTVEFSASDTGVGVDWTEFCTGPSCNPSRGNQGNSLTVDQEGVHTIRFRSMDRNGNAESVQSATVRIDLSEPDVTVAATEMETGEPYTGGWSSEPVRLGVSCEDQSDLSGCDSDSQSLRLVDGPGICPGEGDRLDTDTYEDYDVSEGRVLEDGVYYVCGASQDRATNVGFGGASPDAQQVQVDSTDPDVTATADSPTNDVREEVEYTVEEENLDDCSASGAGVSWSTSESDDNNDGVYEGTATPQSDMDEGDHDVTVVCTDEAGNSGSDTVNMVVDQTDPTVSCDDCASPNPVRSGNEITFDPEVSDDNSGVGTVEICEDEQCSDLFCSTSSGTSCTYETPDNTYDTRDYWVQATDEAGNTADPVGSYSFTMKKWVGESCSSDEACLLGSCTEDEEIGQMTCEATVIPEPGIFLR